MKTKKKKKKKNATHVTYSRKVFLAPDSILSMAAIHTKIKKDGEASIRISDCNRSIKLWNDMNDKKQVTEMLVKIDSLINELSDFRKEVQFKI